MIWNRLTPILIGMTLLFGSTAMADELKTKTYCIGRFLVEVPEEFNRIELASGVRLGSFERIGPGTPEDAERMTRERVRALKSGTLYENDVKQVLRDVIDANAITIISRKNSISIPGYESPVWSIEAYVSSYGMIYRVSNASDKESETETRDRLIAVARAIRPRAPDEIPKGSGICASNDTYVDLPVGADVYDATITAPGIASLTFNILERGPKDEGYISDSGYEGRTRRTEIAGMRGVEIQFRNDDGNEFGAVVSDLDAQGRNGAELIVELKVYDRATLPEAFGKPDTLWGNIKNSVRRKN